MADYLLASSFTLAKTLGPRPFPEVVEASCGLKVVELKMDDPADQRLVSLVAQAMANFIKSTKASETRYKGNRANDVGKKMEAAIIEEMKKTQLKATKLGASGYPDLYVEFQGKRCYIELKTSAQTKKANYRLFYFTSGKKLEMDAHHLLLQVQIEEEADKYWAVRSWQLRDLFNLKVGLKTEWNANNQGFEDAGLLTEG